MALALESLFHPQETSTNQFHLENSQIGSLVRQKIFSYYDRWRNQPNMSPTMNVSGEWCRAVGTSGSRGEKSSCTYWFLSVTTGRGISSSMSSRSSVRLLAREMSIDVLWSELCFTVGKSQTTSKHQKKQNWSLLFTKSKQLKVIVHKFELEFLQKDYELLMSSLKTALCTLSKWSGCRLLPTKNAYC